MSILKKSGVGFRITIPFLESRGWKYEKGINRVSFDKEHYFRIEKDGEEDKLTYYDHSTVEINRIDQVVMFEEMCQAKTQKHKLKLKRKLFGKREKVEPEFWFDPRGPLPKPEDIDRLRMKHKRFHK